MKFTTLYILFLTILWPFGCGQKDDEDKLDSGVDASMAVDTSMAVDVSTGVDVSTNTDLDLDGGDDLDAGGPDESVVDSPWAYFKSPNNSNSDNFGAAVAMSANTVVVGAFGEGSSTNGIINGSDLSGTNDNEPYVGAAYVLTWDGATNWNHQAYLKAPNAAASGDSVLDQDHFGFSVAIDGDTIVVGAYQENSNTSDIINGADLSATNDSGNDNGAVYVFKRSGATWTHEAYLKAPNSTAFQRFGYSVAIDGDTIAVGVPAESSSTTAIINGADLSATNNLGISNGAVYVFTRSGATWSHQAYLKAPNGAMQDHFGTAVAIDGETIVVGATGENSNTTASINGADLSGADNLGDDNGAVYVFTRSGTTWSHQAYLKAPNNSNGDEFGYAVAIYGDTIAVGAMQEASDTTTIIHGDDLSTTNDSGHINGAVYVFTRSGATWSHQAYLKAPRTSVYDAFGQKLSLYDNTIAVSAPGEGSSTNQVIYGMDLSAADDTGNTNGAVYLFERTGSVWAFNAYVKSPNNSNFDQFGWSIAVNDTRVVMGAVTEASTTDKILYGDEIATSTNDDGNENGATYSYTY